MSLKKPASIRFNCLTQAVNDNEQLEPDLTEEQLDEVLVGYLALCFSDGQNRAELKQHTDTPSLFPGEL